MIPERVAVFTSSRTPTEKPTWDRGTGTLSYGSIVCRQFKRFAEIQYMILDEFQKKGWSRSVNAPHEVSRQAVYHLNKGLTEDCPIRFGFSEISESLTWELAR